MPTPITNLNGRILGMSAVSLLAASQQSLFSGLANFLLGQKYFCLESVPAV